MRKTKREFVGYYFTNYLKKSYRNYRYSLKKALEVVVIFWKSQVGYLNLKGLFKKDEIF
jgi:hypothetical protein